MLFSSVMVTLDVLARKLLGMTLGGADEISGYLFAVATAWAFPFALFHRSNVRIDVLYIHMPRRIRATLDLLGITLLGAFAFILTWRAFMLVGDTLENGSLSITPLKTPLIIPQSLWLTGWLFFCFCLVLVVIGVASAFLRGDLAQVQRLGGALSTEEEIDEETRGTLVNHVREG